VDQWLGKGGVVRGLLHKIKCWQMEGRVKLPNFLKAMDFILATRAGHGNKTAKRLVATLRTIMVLDHLDAKLVAALNLL
jgi:hypothetical protein